MEAAQRKTVLSLSIAAFISLITGSSAFSERNIAARILNFGGGENPEFNVKLASNARTTILNSRFRDVMENTLMQDGGVLSVPSQGNWASFGFVDDRQNYVGPHVTTNGVGLFTFPCTIEGDVIIGWAPNGETCVGNTSRIRIGNTSGISNPFSMAASLWKFGTKQINNADEGDELNISSSGQQTLIRTRKLTQFCEHWQSPDGWRGWYCASTSESLESTNNRRPGSRITAREEVISYVVDVLQGDILAQPESAPQAVPVVEGQQYSYPSGEIQPIDVVAAANSCDILKALNPYYAMAENTPDSIRIPLTEQLKGHRDALGVSGRPTILPDLEQGIVEEMNLARTNPTAYAEFLVERRQYFNGNRLELPGETPLMTNEGVAGYDNAISFLQSVRPRPVFAVSSGMSQAAEDLVREQRSQGGIGHGSGANDITGRLARYGTVGCGAGENISYGSRTARDVVIQLIVDEDEASKGHRENMFNPDFLVTGVACGSHPDWRSNCTITYANGYVEAEN
jgi:uncharacterized protein YkwD